MGNFFALLKGIFRNQSEKKIESMLLQMVAISKKDLSGKSKTEQKNFIEKAVARKIVDSPDSLTKELISQFLSTKIPYLRRLFKEPLLIVEQIVRQNLESAKKY